MGLRIPNGLAGKMNLQSDTRSGNLRNRAEPWTLAYWLLIGEPFVSIGSVVQKMIRRRLRRQGFSSAYIHIKGHRLHYLEGTFFGGLGTLFLVHGLGANATSFSPILTRIAPEFDRVIALDLIGHGLNEDLVEPIAVEDVFQILSAQIQALAQGEKISFFGTSLGGGFVLRFASEYPKALRSIALVSPAGPPLRKKDVAHIRGLFSIDEPQSMKRLVEALFHRSPWYGSLLGRELKLAMARPIVQSIVKQLEGIAALSIDDVADLTIPILMIWGQSERVLPRRSLEWYLKYLPDHAYVEQPFGYGHSPHVEVPEDLSARLLHFYRKSAR